jgi:hypothetical protein
MNAMNLPPDHEAERQRIIRGRNLALALGLGAMALLFFFITIAKLS